MKSKPLPYGHASSGKRAVDDMEKIVTAIGASSFGHMEEFDKGEVINPIQMARAGGVDPRQRQGLRRDLAQAQSLDIAHAGVAGRA